MVRKILFSFLQVLILIIISAFFVHNFAFADYPTCTLDFPSQVDDVQPPDNPIPFVINTGNNLASDQTYDVYIGASDHERSTCMYLGDGRCYFETIDGTSGGIKPSTDSSGKQILKFSVDTWRQQIQSDWDLHVDVYHHASSKTKAVENPQPVCAEGIMKFHIVKSTSSGTNNCTSWSLNPSSPKPGDHIKISVTTQNTSGKTGFNPNNTHHVFLYSKNGYQKEWGAYGGLGSSCVTGSDLVNGLDLGELDTDTYTMYIKNCNPAGAAEDDQCKQTFNVDPNGGGFVAEQGGSICRVCPAGKRWDSCTGNDASVTNCCADENSPYQQSDAKITTCPVGFICDPLHRSSDQSTPDKPTGCLSSGSSSPYAESTPPNPPCSNYDNKDNPTKCLSINTGLGVPLPTDPGGLINALLGVVLSIAGGIAIVLIMISGYKMMVSQGNPEQIKDAREQLTAAIIGLLFVVFSLVILQIIGVNILKIPGFGA